MLDEVERAKQELERMKSKEAERLVEIATMKSEEINRKTAETLDKAKQEEREIAKEKTKAIQELKIARDKAIRAEKRIDDMFKQRKIEEQKRHDDLLAREKELEKKRDELSKVQQSEADEREAIQAKFDEIDNSLNGNENMIEQKSNIEEVESSPKKTKSFVTDPCSSSSARFLSTCR